MTMTSIRFPGAVCVLVVVTLALIDGTSGLVQPFQSRSRHGKNVQSLAGNLRIQSRYTPHARKLFQKTPSLLAVDASSSGGGESSPSQSSNNKKNGELEIIEAEVVIESSSPSSDTLSASTTSPPSGETTKEASPTPTPAPAPVGTKNVAKKKTLQDLRAEGGPFTFNTPIGALNPFALYYGITSVVLGIPWFIGCQICRFLSWITGGRFDPKVCSLCICLLVSYSVL